MRLVLQWELIKKIAVKLSRVFDKVSKCHRPAMLGKNEIGLTKSERNLGVGLVGLAVGVVQDTVK